MKIHQLLFLMVAYEKNKIITKSTAELYYLRYINYYYLVSNFSSKFIAKFDALVHHEIKLLITIVVFGTRH